jgi:hypothetical protein
MSKDYAQIANNVGSGSCGRVRQYGEGLWLAFDCGNSDQSPRYKNKGTDGAAVSIAVHCEGCVAYHTKMAHLVWRRGTGRRNEFLPSRRAGAVD